MPIFDVEMPQLGETLTEGVIGKWLKQPGDRVEKYEPLLELLTDKVDIEFPSPVSGVVKELVAAEGATVSVGEVMVRLETQEVVEKAAEEPRGAKAGLRPRRRPTVAAERTDGEPAAPPAGPRVFSPAVRRLAREHGINLSQIEGTGKGGRVTKEDVERYLAAQGGAAPPAPPALPIAPPVHIPVEEVALTRIRKRTAEHMTESKSTIPHAWSSQEVDMTGVVELRTRVKDAFEQREGAPLTFLPFVIKATAEALKEHPMLNAQWGGDKILVKQRLNIGIAIGMDEGLIVPVVHDADHLSITELATRVYELAERARAGKLGLADIQGGTFTVNNTGTFGSVVSYPIIPSNQAAILSMERIVKRPVVIEDDQIVIRAMMFLCLSFDHRVTDGYQAGLFLQEVRRRLEAIGPDTKID